MPQSTWVLGRTKRALDIVLVSGASVIALPLVAMVAVAVRIAMGPRVLFRQQRAGLHGLPFTVMKLRTMTSEHDSKGSLLPDELRLTRFGRLLRSSSLDELPQLWNVLRGEMSLVGPRPLPLTYVDRYSPEQRRRLAARPGLTGWAQVQGRNSLSWPERLALDTWYVDHASFLVDMRILGGTLAAVLGREGVSAEGHATMQEFTGET
jgi:lipopolysaccharide/colanic/teichoic acid biosynthesis glycosyltransferase